MPSPARPSWFRTLISAALPKLLRHLGAALGGWLIGHGVMVGDGSTGGMIAGLVTFGLAWVWSMASKGRALNDAEQSVIKRASEALAAQAVAALSGWLVAAGYEGDAQDPVGVILFGANYGLSALSRPDKTDGSNGSDGANPSVLRQWFLLVVVVLPMVGCVGFEKADFQALARRAEITALESSRVVAQAELLKAQEELARVLLDDEADAKAIGLAAGKAAIAGAAVDAIEVRLAALRRATAGTPSVLGGTAGTPSLLGEDLPALIVEGRRLEVAGSK